MYYSLVYTGFKYLDAGERNSDANGRQNLPGGPERPFPAGQRSKNRVMSSRRLVTGAGGMASRNRAP